MIESDKETKLEKEKREKQREPSQLSAGLVGKALVWIPRTIFPKIKQINKKRQKSKGHVSNCHEFNNEIPQPMFPIWGS